MAVLPGALSLLRKVREADAKAMAGLESMGLADDVDRSLMDEVGRLLDAADAGGDVNGQ